MSCAPTEAQVIEAARPYVERPEPLGLAKLLTTLQTEHGWSLSEKRLKKILIASGLRDGPRKPWVPVSALDESVPLPEGVQAVYLDAVKGRGLVATRDFAEGQTLFVEDAYVAAPPPSELSKMLAGQICSQCFLPTAGSMLSVSCAHPRCHAAFCHRQCQAKAQATHHALLCPGTQPAAAALFAFLEQYQWHSLHTVARCLARVLLTGAAQKPPSVSLQTGATVQGLPSKDAPATFEEVLHHLDSFATVSELERRARNPGWELERAGFLPALQRAHSLLVEALDPRRTRSNRFPVPADAHLASSLDRLFAWETFLTYVYPTDYSWLGRVNINMESHGGLCTCAVLTRRPRAQSLEPRLHTQRVDPPHAWARRCAPRDAYHGARVARDPAG